MSVTSAQPSRTLVVEGLGNLPDLELLARTGGIIKFRYIVEEGDYPGFDSEWREMSENEQREHLRMGRRTAEWLQALNHASEG